MVGLPNIHLEQIHHLRSEPSGIDDLSMPMVF